MAGFFEDSRKLVNSVATKTRDVLQAFQRIINSAVKEKVDVDLDAVTKLSNSLVEEKRDLQAMIETCDKISLQLQNKTRLDQWYADTVGRMPQRIKQLRSLVDAAEEVEARMEPHLQKENCLNGSI